ncbi:transposase, partial [Cytobacillus oceanisediminis]|nr:transposase [Cytobacillus oceanisediminis]
ANYYNTKYRLTGHVFEKRFYDKVIENKEGMLEVSRYIHLNPVEARMVKLAEYYPWSSYQYYKKDSTVPCFMNVNFLLDYYEGTPTQKREKYCCSVTFQ